MELPFFQQLFIVYSELSDYRNALLCACADCSWLRRNSNTMNVLIGVKVAIIEFERKSELFFVSEKSKLSRLVQAAVEAVDKKVL